MSISLRIRLTEESRRDKESMGMPFLILSSFLNCIIRSASKLVTCASSSLGQ